MASNNWIEHVKKTAQEHGISYKDALKVASKTYKKGTHKSGKGFMSQEQFNDIYHVGQQRPKGMVYMAAPKGKGIKKKGKGFFDSLVNAVDKIGTDTGKAFPVNPYSLGRDLGENYIGPAIIKSMKK